MTLGSRSSPAITSAGSPGSNCSSEKINTDTKNSVGISCRIRLARKLSMGRCFFRMQRGVAGACALQLQPDDTHQSVRHRLVALQLFGMRDQELAVEEVD